MVKIHCDKCGAEIKDKYYTVNIYGHDTNPKYDYTMDYGCSSSAFSNTRDDILKTLNATKMYCENCRDKIEAFIENA
jgi:hypothetical protein